MCFLLHFWKGSWKTHNLKNNRKKTLSRLYIIEFENYKRWTCSKSNSHEYIKRLKFWFFRQIMCWGIKDSIIKREESWITFVLPLPCFDVFDSDHFLKNFGSKLFSIKNYISQIILLTITCWCVYRWLDRN